MELRPHHCLGSCLKICLYLCLSASLFLFLSLFPSPSLSLCRMATFQVSFWMDLLPWKPHSVGFLISWHKVVLFWGKWLAGWFPLTLSNLQSPTSHPHLFTITHYHPHSPNIAQLPLKAADLQISPQLYLLISHYMRKLLAVNTFFYCTFFAKIKRFWLCSALWTSASNSIESHTLLTPSYRKSVICTFALET